MKFKTFTLRTNLLSKLLLSLALLIGSADVWADDIVIYNEGAAIPDGWTKNSSISVDGNKLVSSGNTAGYITSSTTFNIANQKLVIVAKRTDNTDAYVRLSDGSGYSYTARVTFGYGTTSKTYELYSSEHYIELISGLYSVSGKNLRITAKNVEIKSIKFCDNKEFVLDESNPTALLKGDVSETVRFKYSAKKNWNTICVPFSLKKTVSTPFDHVETIFGDDYKVYSLSNYDSGILTFTQVAGALNANVPYLVYAPNAVMNASGVELTSNVSITYPSGDAARQTPAGTAIFQGTYVTKNYDAEDDENPWYGVTPAGGIMKAGTDAYVKGYRAYFTGVAAPTPDAEVKMVVLDDDGGTTDLGFVKMVDADAKEVYNLAGQKVQKGRKGIYIVNGKKVVIK